MQNSAEDVETLEFLHISSENIKWDSHHGNSVHTCISHFSTVQLLATLWPVARQVPLSMGILQPRILEWVVIPFSIWDLPNPGIEPESLTSTCISKRVLYH